MRKLKKLNIGSGEWVMKGYVNIDDGSDWGGFAEMKERADNFMAEEHFKAELLEMDGNKTTFADGEFDEIYSNQCVGEYVTNYKEIARILKLGGKVKLGVWAHLSGKVIYKLAKVGIIIYKMNIMNGELHVDDDDCTFIMEGIKVSW